MASLFKAHLFSSVAAELLDTKNTAADNNTEKRILLSIDFIKKRRGKRMKGNNLF